MLITRLLHWEPKSQPSGCPHPSSTARHPPTGCGERLREAVWCRKTELRGPSPALRVLDASPIPGGTEGHRRRQCGQVSAPPAPALTGFSLEPAPCPSGLALGEDRAQRGVTPGRERPGCSPLHTRCAVTHTLKPSQLDLRFCKTRCQPNVKHIVSPKQLEGGEQPSTLPP